MNPSVNYPLRYRSFTALLEEVRVDMKNFSLEGKIEPQSLIKVALRCNYDLGLRINQTKETVIEVDHKTAKLPNDFYIMNFALLCGEFSVQQIMPQGTHIEDKIIPKYQVLPPINSCVTPEPLQCAPTRMADTNTPLCLTTCGDGIELIRKIHTETRHYKHMLPIRFVNTLGVDCKCPNLFFKCTDEARIKNGYVYTNFECGDLYINYEGMLEDKNGGLLIPDHPFLNEMYEYSLKQRILENILMDGDAQDVTAQLQLVETRLRAARSNALSLVNTPNFSEMQATWTLNRRAMNLKYYQSFSSFPYADNFDYHNII